MCCVQVTRDDFFEARASITPAAARSAATHARPLSLIVAPALAPPLETLFNHAQSALPMVSLRNNSPDGGFKRRPAAPPNRALAALGGSGKENPKPKTPNPKP